MKQVACYHCGNDQSTAYATENGFNLVKCSHCGLLYVNPRPDDSEIEAAHKVGLHRGQNTLNVTGSFRQGNVRRFLKILGDIFEDKSCLSKKKWLDIGCGNGEFLVALRKFSDGGIIEKGVEPNVHKIKEAKKRGLDVCYFDLDSHTGKYDVISLLNVYSHLPDPPAMIAAWKNLLSPGGELILETGNTCNLSSKDHHKPFYLPDHLSFASEEIVVKILKKNGFQIVKVIKYPLIERDVVSFIKEIIKMIMPNKKSNIRNLFQYEKYKHTDMFIRAKMIDSSVGFVDGGRP